MTTQIIRILHGSHLYGTNTPASDLDYKGVHLPSVRGLILQRPETVIDRKIKVSQTVKNTHEDTDEQSFAIQKFFDMLASGDTVATEILFAPPLEQHSLWNVIRDQRHLALNRQCKGFVGYCQRQAAKYGIKGSRMAAVKRLTDFLAAELEQEPRGRKLDDIKIPLLEMTEGQEHMSWENIPHPNGADCWHVVCCDRKMPMTVAIADAHAVYAKVWENYGHRSRAAMENDGIDWKAMSHAVRVARQAIELLSTHAITFPRPDAEELLAIKLGRFPYREIAPLLEGLVAEVEEVAKASTLPESADKPAIDDLIFDLHRRHIEGEFSADA